MAQDLRKLFKEERQNKKFTMYGGHEERFLQRLDEALPVDKKSNKTLWLSIAASVIIFLGVGIFFLINERNKQQIVPTTVVDRSATETKKKAISLGDLSPDLQKIEAYYTTTINLELASLEISDVNKNLVDGYLEQLAELNAEYTVLNEELNEMGPNDQTISALIKNLQLRLQLLQKLKSKLNQIKSVKNEQQANIV